MPGKNLPYDGCKFHRRESLQIVQVPAVFAAQYGKRVVSFSLWHNVLPRFKAPPHPLEVNYA